MYYKKKKWSIAMDFSQAVQYKMWPSLCKCSFGYSETYFIALQDDRTFKYNEQRDHETHYDVTLKSTHLSQCNNDNDILYFLKRISDLIWIMFFFFIFFYLNNCVNVFVL